MVTIVSNRHLFIYFCVMLIKRDRVNRVTGLVYLPIDGSGYIVGDTISFKAEEKDIGLPLVLDPMEMHEPVNGNAVGDAVFDAGLRIEEDHVIDARDC